MKKLLSLFLSLGLVLSGCSKEDNSTDNSSNSVNNNESGSLFGNILGTGDSSTSADEMRLEDFTGNITLQNQMVEKAVVLGSRLVTGDNIETMIESHAYVVLDLSKVLRVNEISQVEIVQDNKHLDIHLSKGTVFFNVKAALTPEESLEFHTNNVVAGVRGTSGIIHYDPVNQLTQIVVLTGTVTGTTNSEEQNIEAGQIAIVKTLEDGSVEMTIYELEDEDPLYYFPDHFIDGIQGDLNGEGDSVPLSELVREPEGVIFPEYINTIGNNRTLTQNKAIVLQELLQSTEADVVSFVDDSTGSSAVLLGTLVESYEYDEVTREDIPYSYYMLQLYQWIGDSLSKVDVSYFSILEENNRYYVTAHKGETHATTYVTTMAYYDYPLSQAVHLDEPERIFFTLTSRYYDTNLTEVTNAHSSNPIDALFHSALPTELIRQFLTEEVENEFLDYLNDAVYNGTFGFQDNSYYDANTEYENRKTVLIHSIDSPHWNTIEDMLLALES